MAAAAGAAGVGDSTLTWAFERLIDCPALPVHVLTDTLLPVVAAVLADLPDCTRARLCLRLVDSDLQESRVDETTLEYLRELAACDVAPQADPALVRPSPELLLQVGARAAGGPRGSRSRASQGARRWGVAQAADAADRRPLPHCAAAVTAGPPSVAPSCNSCAFHAVPAAQVKTLAGLEALGLPPPDGEDLLNKVFSGGHAGVQITAEEWARCGGGWASTWAEAAWLCAAAGVAWGVPAAQPAQWLLGSWSVHGSPHNAAALAMACAAGTRSCWARWATLRRRRRCVRSTQCRQAEQCLLVGVSASSAVMGPSSCGAPQHVEATPCVPPVRRPPRCAWRTLFARPAMRCRACCW